MRFYGPERSSRLLPSSFKASFERGMTNSIADFVLFHLASK
jgi:hypothetical protein